MQRVSNSINTSIVDFDLPATQYGHNKCALLTFPHAEHLFRAVTSFNPFPAMNLWRFFLCEVFFFGTARSIDSHSPGSIGGIFKLMEMGTARADPNKGWASCWAKRAVRDRSVGVEETCRFGNSDGNRAWRSAMFGVYVAVEVAAKCELGFLEIDPTSHWRACLW